MAVSAKKINLLPERVSSREILSRKIANFNEKKPKSGDITKGIQVLYKEDDQQHLESEALWKRKTQNLNQ